MNFFTDYRFPGLDDVRSLTALPNDEYVAICSCGMNHSFCTPGKEDILYVLETRSPFKCKTESSWVGTVRDLQSLVLYRYPYTNDVRSISLLRDNSYISVCSCGMNHSYSGKYIEEVSFGGGAPRKCKTPISWCGNVGDLKKRITDLMNSQKNIVHTENNQKREQANKNSPEYRYAHDDEIRDLAKLNCDDYAAICSCGMNHLYLGLSLEQVYISPNAFKCRTQRSFTGKISLLQKSIANHVSESKQNNNAAEFAIKDSEISLLLAIRKEYEKPPDKGIVAALLIPMWLRKQRMPLCNTDSLFELYDVPIPRSIG